MAIVAGIDLGSRVTKAVIVNQRREILGRSRLRTHPDLPRVAREAMEAALADAGLEEGELDYIATTGFARYNVPFRDIQITDITCAARGAALLFPGTRCVLDVGAQNTRAIRIIEGGRVKEFHSNDKCAAGAGGFVERAARYLEVPLEAVGELSLKADKPQTISSVCAVLAESEIINHVTAGLSVENILRGVHDSLSMRALGILKRVGLEPEITLVGGLSNQEGMKPALEETLKMPVNVSPDSQLAGALGAALLALQRVEKGFRARASSGREHVAVEAA